MTLYATRIQKNGIPAEEQVKAYIAMLGATAGLKGDISSGSIFDFSLAAEAAERSVSGRDSVAHK